MSTTIEDADEVISDLRDRIKTFIEYQNIQTEEIKRLRSLIEKAFVAGRGKMSWRKFQKETKLI